MARLRGPRLPPALLPAAARDPRRAALTAQKGALPALVARAQQEEHGRAEQALGVLHACSQVGASCCGCALASRNGAELP
jgi:hypothetical protein